MQPPPRRRRSDGAAPAGGRRVQDGRLAGQDDVVGRLGFRLRTGQVVGPSRPVPHEAEWVVDCPVLEPGPVVDVTDEALALRREVARLTGELSAARARIGELDGRLQHALATLRRLRPAAGAAGSFDL